jgi:hypothetical protein
MKPIKHALDFSSSHLAPPQSEWVFLPRLGGCESLSAALSSGRRCGFQTALVAAHGTGLKPCGVLVD